MPFFYNEKKYSSQSVSSVLVETWVVEYHSVFLGFVVNQIFESISNQLLCFFKPKTVLLFRICRGGLSPFLLQIGDTPQQTH